MALTIHKSGKTLTGANQLNASNVPVPIKDGGGNPQKTGHLKPAKLVDFTKPLR